MDVEDVSLVDTIYIYVCTRTGSVVCIVSTLYIMHQRTFLLIIGWLKALWDELPVRHCAAVKASQEVVVRTAFSVRCTFF
jgi:hypothetical protein